MNIRSRPIFAIRRIYIAGRALRIAPIPRHDRRGRHNIQERSELVSESRSGKSGQRKYSSVRANVEPDEPFSHRTAFAERALTRRHYSARMYFPGSICMDNFCIASLIQLSTIRKTQQGIFICRRRLSFTRASNIWSLRRRTSAHDRKCRRGDTTPQSPSNYRGCGLPTGCTTRETHRRFRQSFPSVVRSKSLSRSRHHW